MVNIRIILLAILVAIVGFLSFAGYMYYSRVAATHMDESLILKAEVVLEKGVSIEDPAQDFPLMGQKGEDIKEKPNNNNPYNFSFLDIKEVRISKDEDYLYFKIIFFDKIPKKAPRLNGDRIEGDGIKMNFVNEKGEEQIDLAINYDFIPFGIISSNCYYSSQPTGIEWPEDARFAKTERNCKMFLKEDYVLGAMPIQGHPILAERQIYFNVQHEAESKKYDHAAVDVLRGSGKMPAVINWTSGTENIEIYDTFYQN